MKSNVVIVLLLVLGAAFAVTGAVQIVLRGTGTTWSQDQANRHGLPRGYEVPVNIRSWNNEDMATLYPGGDLVLRANPKLVIRTAIDRQMELTQAMNDRRVLMDRLIDRAEQLHREATNQLAIVQAQIWRLTNEAPFEVRIPVEKWAGDTKVESDVLVLPGDDGDLTLPVVVPMQL